MRLIFICISTRAYPYDFWKIDIIFMLKRFVIFIVTFTSLHVGTIARVQNSAYLGIDK